MGKIGWPTFAISALLACAGVLLYVFGPDASHMSAAGSITGAVAIGAGAFRK